MTSTKTPAPNKETREFHYRLSWAAPSFHPGHHRGKQIGGGQELREFADFLRYPDARRIDMRQSLRDPFGNFLVRVYNQKSLVQVYALADLSASLNFMGRAHKRTLMLQFLKSLAQSTARTGDPFGFIGCGSSLDLKLFHPTSHTKGAEDLLKQCLREQKFDRGGAGALKDVAQLLVGQKKLLFLVSDFHMPLKKVEEILETIHAHAVVPIVLWDKGEYEELPNWGITRVSDLESGRQRLLFLRPRLKEKIVTAYLDRREKLKNLFFRHGARPFFLEDSLNTDALTEHFLGG